MIEVSKRMKATLWISALLATFFPLEQAQSKVLPAGRSALVLIDMQEHFLSRGDMSVPNNKVKLRRVLEIQRRLIAEAIRRSEPIVVVEFASYGPTDPSLTSALQGYGRVIRISKKEQGLFEDSQASVEFNRHMATHGVNQLRVAGVNGGACVRDTILGAVERGFRVRAISDGIAEISTKYTDISHPYRFGSTDPLVESPGTQFRQSVSRRIRSDFFETTSAETRSIEDVISPGFDRPLGSRPDSTGRR